MKGCYPFRLGTSSYIIPADILPNVAYLADQVDDVELLLFESDDFSNLPHPKVVEMLGERARQHGLSYTVHLPLDCWPGAADEAERKASVGRWLRVVELMEPINPFAYVVHFGCDQGRGYDDPADDVEIWREQLRRSAADLLASGIPAERFCIETLGYPFELVEDIVQEFGFSICLDIGHVWLNGYDDKAYIERYLPRARVIHLHGVAHGKDHQGLSVLDEERLQFFLNCLVEPGAPERVVTLEVFGEKDFEDSIACLEQRLPPPKRGRVCLVSGGCRSGKSRFALERAVNYSSRAFLATAEAFDEEMKLRIKRHQAEREGLFSTLEEPLDLSAALKRVPEGTEVLLIDCMTVWIGNLMHHCGVQKERYAEVQAFLDSLRNVDYDVILVTNEVGQGIVPEHAMSRAFRDHCGWLNQDLAALADDVVFVVSGIPMVLKK